MWMIMINKTECYASKQYPQLRMNAKRWKKSREKNGQKLWKWKKRTMEFFHKSIFCVIAACVSHANKWNIFISMAFGCAVPWWCEVEKYKRIPQTHVNEKKYIKLYDYRFGLNWITQTCAGLCVGVMIPMIWNVLSVSVLATDLCGACQNPCKTVFFLCASQILSQSPSMCHEFFVPVVVFPSFHLFKLNKW